MQESLTKIDFFQVNHLTICNEKVKQIKTISKIYVILKTHLK